jgi:Tripartite tricarboxylate transporter TctB family
MTTYRFAACLTLICALAIWQVTVIPPSPMFSVVGATLVPAIVVGLLCVCTAFYWLSVKRRLAPDLAHTEGEQALPGSTVRVLSFLFSGLVFIVAIKWLGFVITAALAGMGVAKAFDAPLNWKSALICLAIAGFFWVLFDRLLSVELGPLFPLLSSDQ